MSLLDEAFEPFIILNKSVIDDGYGGVIISSYTSTIGIGIFIFKATSTTVTLTGSSNTCYVAQLD